MMVDNNQDTVLIVDDSEINRLILREILEEYYRIIEVESGEQALEYIEEHIEEISVVLLDLEMPNMHGKEVLHTLKQKGILMKLPVIVITSNHTEQEEVETLNAGAVDFIKKPFCKQIVIQRISNINDLYKHRNSLERKINEINDGMIEALSAIVEYRSIEVGTHTRRIQLYTEVMLEHLYQHAERYPEFEITKDKIKLISHASMLHDIGKISIPDHILLKPGKLTGEEFEVMKEHSHNGDMLINNFRHIYNTEYKVVLHEICRSHHEKWNGTGYPDHLKGNQIPISAQIVGVADVYDALTSERVYKAAYSHEEAVKIINEEKDKLFSPDLIQCFNECTVLFEGILYRLNEQHMSTEEEE